MLPLLLIWNVSLVDQNEPEETHVIGDDVLEVAVEVVVVAEVVEVIHAETAKVELGAVGCAGHLGTCCPDRGGGGGAEGEVGGRGGGGREEGGSDEGDDGEGGGEHDGEGGVEGVE